MDTYTYDTGGTSFADLPCEMTALPPKGQDVSRGERGRKEKIVNVIVLNS